MKRRELMKYGLILNAAFIPHLSMNLFIPTQSSKDGMKTLGLIGGTSWHSTIEYYRHINILVGERMNSRLINPPLLLYSLNVDLMRRGDWDEIHQTYLEISRLLENAGAEAILICANTPHKVIPWVAPQLKVPFIHIADAIGDKARELKLKKLGLLGTKETMKEAFISGHLSDHHQIETEVPDEEIQPLVHQSIVQELTQGIFKEETKSFFLNEMGKMRSKGVEGIILGCTELPMLVDQQDFDLPLLDTTYLHAAKAVDFILG